MNPMHTAPRDGTRVMVKVVIVAYRSRINWDPIYGMYRPVGTAWQESWFDGEKWQPWLGSKKITSTGARSDSPWWVKGWRPVSVLEDPSGPDVPGASADSTGGTSPSAGGTSARA